MSSARRRRSRYPSAAPGGELDTYGGCEVLYIDTELDLAFLRFHGGKKVLTEGFSLYPDPVEDGTEIWSAGFPNLLGRPVWQFARGTITNAQTRLPELQDPEISPLLQHSASIDPGNSGGPLLIKRPGADSIGYQVTGINTWQISNRRNTFFAIPVSVMPEVMEKARAAVALKADSAALKDALVKHCRILAAEIGSRNPDFEKLHDYLSYMFFARDGWDSFLAVLKQQEGNEEELEFWQYSFFNYSPVETMRLALARLFLQTLRPEGQTPDIRFEGINFADEEKFSVPGEIRTDFSIDGVKKEIFWRYELGRNKFDQ